ncbi:MAG: CBS domain-containing protein [Pseudohongiellaceae bacterium]
MQVSEVMEKRHRTAATSDDLQHTLELMHAEGLEAIPVTGPDGAVAGMLWLSSILEALPDDKLDEALEETFPASDPISPDPGSG